jgi:tetratricopeptide (TPR) repeat protein
MKVGFIGTGNMGGALAHAAAQSPAPAELLLSNRTPEKAQALAQQLGATVSDNETIAQTCDYIFLGVKPQMMADLLARLRPILSRRQEGFVLVSMAAGLTLQRLREMAGLSCPILRIMPNTACAVGAGLTLYVPSPEVTELLLHRLGLVWTPEPEGLAPCWKALLSGSPNFDSLYEQLVQPRREILASSPLAADALLLDAFYADEMRPLPVEWEPFLSTRQLALQRGLQGRWEEAVRLEPLPLLAAHYGEFLYAEGEYTAAIEVLRDAYRSASDAGYPYLMLSCRAWMGNCYSDLGRMEEMLTHYSVAERLAEALRDTGSLSALRYNVASTQLELGQPEKALPYFASLPRPGFLDLHKLAICHEQLGHREQALTAVQQAEPMASGEMEQRMLALVRYRLEHPDYLHDDTYGTQLLDCFQRLRDTYPMGFTRFHLPWVLAWYKANRQYRQACRLLEEFPVK